MPTTTVSPAARESFETVELQQFEVTLSIIYFMLRSGIYTRGSREMHLYAAVCHVATVLRSRLAPPPVYWHVALDLFVGAERIWENDSDGTERAHLRSCISMAREHLRMVESDPSSSGNQDAENTYMGRRTIRDLILDMLNQYTIDPDGFLQQHLLEIFGAAPPTAPPTSKGAIENLPTIIVIDEIQCAICLEDVTVKCNVLEMPCKHLFHAPCLKPWLDKSNSCPLCRYELKTEAAPTVREAAEGAPSASATSSGESA